MNYNDKLQGILKDIRKLTDFQPKVALILGSGLGGFGEKIKQEKVIEYSQLSNFPISTVAGHSGRFIFGYLDEVPMVVMQGRVHYYEGYPMEDVVLPVRLMGLLGAEVLFLSNAAGGSNKHYVPGTLMLIRDHISTMVPSPLIGANLDDLGPRFPDMTNVYDDDLRDIIRHSARKLDIHLEEGVYMQFTGPAYETPSEVRMAQMLGADAVGMSTACEAMAANHMGMKVCGISCITNMASGLNLAPLDHKEVQEVADRVSDEFQSLVKESIINIAKTL